MSSKLSNALRFAKLYQADIYTWIGAAGVVVTAALAAKASPKAIDILKDEQFKKEDELNVFETVKAVAPVYLPAVISGAVSIACIFESNTVHKHKEIGLMSACSVANAAYRKYRDNVKDSVGKDIDDDILEKTVKEHIADEEHLKPISETEELYYEPFSGVYFNAEPKNVAIAEYLVNKKFMEHGYASLNDFYGYLGIPKSELGDAYGWSAESGIDSGYSDTGFESGPGMGAWINVIRKESGSEYDQYSVLNIIDYIFEPSAEYLLF